MFSMTAPFGKALMDYYLLHENASYRIVREDGLVSEEPVEFYFRNYNG